MATQSPASLSYKDAATVHNAKDSRLLSLPREIRDTIWKYALADDIHFYSSPPVERAIEVNSSIFACIAAQSEFQVGSKAKSSEVTFYVEAVHDRHVGCRSTVLRKCTDPTNTSTQHHLPGHANALWANRQGILVACKQTYEETKTLFWACVHWIIGNVESIRSLHTLLSSRERLGSVHHLELHYRPTWELEKHQMHQYTQLFRNLQRLDLVLTFWSWQNLASIRQASEDLKDYSSSLKLNLPRLSAIKASTESELRASTSEEVVVTVLVYMQSWGGESANKGHHEDYSRCNKRHGSCTFKSGRELYELLDLPFQQRLMDR